MIGPLRNVTAVERFRTPSHPRLAADSAIVSLDCGHQRRYKGSEWERRKRHKLARCQECARR